jgi:hypothetical protein
MSNFQYKVGQVLQGRKKRLLIVRIVKSQSLFETEEGDCYTLDEHYLELRDPNGGASFIRLASQRTPYTESKGNMKAMQPIYSKEEEIYGEVDTAGTENSSEG